MAMESEKWDLSWRSKPDPVDDLDEGLFASYYDFQIDPELDPLFQGQNSINAMQAQAKRPPSGSFDNTVPGVPKPEVHNLGWAVANHMENEAKNRKKPKAGEEPAIAEEGMREYLEDYWRLDPRIKKLAAQTVPATPVNLEWCFWHEPTCRAMATSIFATIVGDGIQIVTRNKKIKDILDKYNDEVLISDIIRDLVFDNIIHGDALFIKKYIKFGKDDEEKLRIFRIDMRTIRKIQHDFEGWTKWMQYAYVRHEVPKTKKNFDADSYDPMPLTDPNLEIRYGEKGSIHTTQILEEEALWFNLFRESPMKAILDVTIHKKWIIIFIRKSAYRYSTPVPVVKVGTEQHHPTSVDNYKKILKNASNRASMWRNFDSWAIPFNWDLHLEQPRATGNDMVQMVKFLNEEIMLALSGSISLYQNVGSALSSGGKTIMENYLNIIKGMRTKIAHVLVRNLYREVLIMAGFTEEELDKEANKFKIGWTELTNENMKDYVQTVLDMHNSGLMKDKVETRNLLRKQLPELEEVDDEGELNGDNLDVVQNKKQSLPEEDAVTDLLKQANGGKKKSAKS